VPAGVGAASAGTSPTLLPSQVFPALAARWQRTLNLVHRLPSVIVLPNLAPPG
jgi:hypothetical protein